jgi:6-phospho-3-hexuloisomerase
VETISAQATIALTEIGDVLRQTDDDATSHFVEAILEADRIALYGLGREGLMLRAFAMRLVHLGLDTHIAGDVTALPIGPASLAIVSAGPGDLRMAETIVRLAREAGSRVVVITAQPDRSVPSLTDLVIIIPAQTMANDAGSASMLPMGSAFEIAMLIYLDLVAIRLRERTGQSLDDLRQRHFNLE